MCFVEGGGWVKKHRTKKKNKKTTKQTNNEPNIICEGMFLLKFVTAPPPLTLDYFQTLFCLLRQHKWMDVTYNESIEKITRLL